jgi:hypothetical protein
MEKATPILKAFEEMENQNRADTRGWIALVIGAAAAGAALVQAANSLGWVGC